MHDLGDWIFSIGATSAVRSARCPPWTGDEARRFCLAAIKIKDSAKIPAHESCDTLTVGRNTASTLKPHGLTIWPRQKRNSLLVNALSSQLYNLKEPNELALSAAPLSSHLSSVSSASLDPEMQLWMGSAWTVINVLRAAFFAPSVARKHFGTSMHFGRPEARN